MSAHQLLLKSQMTERLCDSGVYVIWLYLPNDQYLQVGRLGKYYFYNGVYAYCGSAQKNLQKRIFRHQNLIKKNRWHIDYLRAVTQYLGVVTFGLGKSGECWLVEEILKMPTAHYPVRGFGSSDCTCPSHLLRVPALKLNM